MNLSDHFSQENNLWARENKARKELPGKTKQSRSGDFPSSQGGLCHVFHSRTVCSSLFMSLYRSAA